MVSVKSVIGLKVLSHLCPLVCSRSQRGDNVDKQTSELLHLPSACVVFT